MTDPILSGWHSLPYWIVDLIKSHGQIFFNTVGNTRYSFLPKTDPTCPDTTKPVSTDFFIDFF